MSVKVETLNTLAYKVTNKIISENDILSRLALFYITNKTSNTINNKKSIVYNTKINETIYDNDILEYEYMMSKIEIVEKLSLTETLYTSNNIRIETEILTKELCYKI